MILLYWMMIFFIDKHLNIISGRRTHLMRYKKNNELKKYANWIIDQKIVNGSDYNIFITTGAGAIYPPDN